jgi:hypothetical protein
MTPRVVVATPVYGGHKSGSVSAGYMTALFALANRVRFVPHIQLTNRDLVRARSRAARIALDACATHLLFWDEDVVGNAALAVAGMLDQNVDVIAASYPRKHLPPEPTHRGTHVAMGFTLIRVSVLERMWDHYYDELQFDDVLENKPYRTVALFQLLFLDRNVPRPHRALLSEDFSFCERWLRMGGVVHLYDGPGAPMGHVGSFVYQGTREEMNRE